MLDVFSIKLGVIYSGMPIFTCSDKITFFDKSIARKGKIEKFGASVFPPSLITPVSLASFLKLVYFPNSFFTPRLNPIPSLLVSVLKLNANLKFPPIPYAVLSPLNLVLTPLTL